LGLVDPPTEIGPLLQSPTGSPLSPPGFVASISHKVGIAIAIAEHDTGQGIGVDIECLIPERNAIAIRVLRDDERAELSSLAAGDDWINVVARFSIKEATYKALNSLIPTAQVDFKNVTVHGIVGPSGQGTIQSVTVEMDPGSLPFLTDIQAFVWVFGIHVISLACSTKDPIL
jgi:4'-phosphopantetheinyl transferase EntD